jgi:peptide/nickel transport system substrate-binding protein
LTWLQRLHTVLSMRVRSRSVGGVIARTKRVVILAAMTISLAVSCSDSESGDTATSASATTEAAGETSPEATSVTLALESFDAETWDPSQAIAQRYHGLLYENLYRRVPPDGDVRPDLVAEDAVSDDLLTWTLTLHDGIMFSNGDALTADDVAFSLDRYRSEESLTAQASLFRDGVEQVRALDERTVEIRLTRPWPTLPLALTETEGKVLPMNYIESVGWETLNREPVGSGPYRLVDHSIGESMTFEAVEDYWRGTPPFERVTVLNVPEEEARIALIQSGDADFISSVSADRTGSLEDAGFTTLAPPRILTWFVGFLGSYPESTEIAVSDAVVREALDLATDKEAINAGLHGGLGELIPYAPNTESAIGAPSDLAPTSYDPERARDLLMETQFADGFELDLYAPSQSWCDSVTSRRIGEALVDMWSEIGVETALHTLDYTAFRPQFTPDLSPELVGSAVLFCPRQTLNVQRDLFVWYSGDGPVKLTNVADAEIAAVQEASTEQELIDAAESAYRKIYDSHVAIPLLSGSQTFAVADTLAYLPVFPGEVEFMAWLLPSEVLADWGVPTN